MAKVNAASLRQEFEDEKARIAALRADGKLSRDVDASFRALVTLLSILITVLLEKTTRKGSQNSSLPPSQTDKDETARRKGTSGKGAKQNQQTGAGLRKTTVKETVTVETCEACGGGLSDVDAIGRERRILFDIVFEVVERRVDAEVKECPECRARTKGRFPDTMPGPLQYGVGLQAFVINLLVAHMLSLRRAVALVQAISGLRLSEATCLGYVRRLHDALQSWEDAAIEHLLKRPALHVDETGFRVDGKTQWLHVATDGALTLKFVHPKRGGEAIEDIGIIPRYTGTLVHDCWGAYFVYDQCTHQLCGSHLLRELTFIVDSNGFRWARLMKKLLREACHRVNRSDAKTLTAAERRAVRKRYRTILTQGGKELPEIPPRPKGKRGRVAKSDAHNLHERLEKHEESVLRFTANPDVSFTNNAGEQKIRMSKVKIKVSGCFRTQLQAKAWCRVSSYLDSMAALGYDPLVAIQIALAGDAAAMIALHQARTAPGKACSATKLTNNPRQRGLSSYPESSSPRNGGHDRVSSPGALRSTH